MNTDETQTEIEGRQQKARGSYLCRSVLSFWVYKFASSEAKANREASCMGAARIWTPVPIGAPRDNA